MKITNNHGLPDIIYKAICNDTYNPGKADISVTTLIGPVQKRLLTEKHGGEMVVDASTRIWAFHGQTVHSVIERVDIPGALFEERLYASIGGRRISGQIDIFHDGALIDIKTTSVWSIKRALEEGKSEWDEQLNVYAWLLRQSGLVVNKLEIVVIARDWRRTEALSYGKDYPKETMMIPVRMWSNLEMTHFILNRLAAHYGLSDAGCTDIERWKSEDVYKVMKKGNKRSYRNLPSFEEAEAWMKEKGKGDTIVKHDGGYIRCESYCDVSSFCPQHQQHLREQENE